MNLVDELYAITAALAAAGIRYAVCGGVAVTMYGATRSTKDIDILIMPEDVPRALDAVRPLGYVFAAIPMTFGEGTKRERHVQRVSKIQGDEHLLLDLLFADAAFEGGLDEAATSRIDRAGGREVARRASRALRAGGSGSRAAPILRDPRGAMVRRQRGFRRGSGKNALVVCWYARYASPLLRSACASVAGMPVTFQMLARMSAWPPSAMRPAGQNARP